MDCVSDAGAASRSARPGEKRLKRDQNASARGEEKPDQQWRSTFPLCSGGPGIESVGNRAEQNAKDDVPVRAVARTRSDTADTSRALAEREALVQRQRERVRQLEQQMPITENTGRFVRTGLTR